MSKTVFDDIAKANYEGVDSANPLAYRYYDANRKVLGKTMADHLRIAICYWHTFCFAGQDMFGDPTYDRPWFTGDPMKAAHEKLKNAFAFFERMGTPYFCFHDRDIAPEGDTFKESARNIKTIVDAMAVEMDRTGVKLLWGTANLFSHPRYAAGASTNPDPEVFAYAAAQVRLMMDVTKRLGGENYVLWGGREGYETLLNTDLRREYNQLARFLTMVVEYKHKIGFKGTLLIEPKPHEPTKYQYDRDAEAVCGFLERHGLSGEFKLNIEANHCILAGHSFPQQLAYATAHNMLGSVDINRGDPQLGWDTDQFPNDVAEATHALYIILKGGGLGTGGFNFDAKLRRLSMDPVDLFHAHVGGIDVLARGLLNAAALIEDGALDTFVADRYKNWDANLGKDILAGATTLDQLADKVAAENINPRPTSGRQEMLENLMNRYV